MSEIVNENGLLERLKQQGLDVYMDGEFDCMRDRLAHVIRAYRYAPIIVGKRNGKPESYEQLFERIYGVALKDCASSARAAAKAIAR